jgi:iron complex outermembrane receptor protein
VNNWLYGARLKAVWTPTDAAKITASVDGGQSRSGDLTAWVQTDPKALGYVLGAPVFSGPYAAPADFPNHYDEKQHNGTVRGDFNLGRATLVSITGYRHYHNFNTVDLDATILPVLHSNAVQNWNQYSQELQLLSAKDSSFDWILGLYGYYEDSEENPNRVISEFIFPKPIDTQKVGGIVRTRSYAGFAQATWPLRMISEKLNLTLGGRYTSDKKHFNGFAQLEDATGSVVIPLPAQTLSKSWSKFTPKVSLDYKLGDVLLYASYSQGYKSGAFNLLQPGTPGPVDPETLNAYEVGIKSQLLDNRLRLNFAAFHYLQKNIQIQITTPESSGLATLQNAAIGRVNGAELTWDAYLPAGFTVDGNLTYLDSRYLDYANFLGIVPTPTGSITVPIDAKGNRLQRTPVWSGTLGATYHANLPSGELLVSSNLSLKGRYFWSASNAFQEPAHTVLNASIAYTFAGSPATTVSLWGRNLTDEYRLLNLQAIGGIGTVVEPDIPRMYGISLGVRF